MDGSSEHMTDIILISTTNKLEAIDHAMLRGGRFSEKSFFPNPDVKMLESTISRWLSGIKLKIAFSITEAVEVLNGLPFSTAREALQTSVNQAIGLEKKRLSLGSSPARALYYPGYSGHQSIGGHLEKGVI